MRHVTRCHVTGVSLSYARYCRSSLSSVRARPARAVLVDCGFVPLLFAPIAAAGTPKRDVLSVRATSALLVATRWRHSPFLVSSGSPLLDPSISRRREDAWATWRSVASQVSAGCVFPSSLSLFRSLALSLSFAECHVRRRIGEDSWSSPKFESRRERFGEVPVEPQTRDSFPHAARTRRRSKSDRLRFSLPRLRIALVIFV